YFPLAFMVKTPLSLLCLLPLAVVFNKPCKQRYPAAVAIVFAIVYAVSLLFSPLNIGYRHMLPVLAIAYIWVGAFMNPSTPWKIILSAVFIIYQMGNTVVHSPYHLGWFNAISGGPKHGWRYLADSNTDWGQGFMALREFQKSKGIDTLNLAGFVFYDPQLYNLDYAPLTPMRGNTPAIFPSRFSPEPGHYAISLTSLDGVPLADNEMYDWFRWRQPDACIANAIHYYAVTEKETVTNWIAQCTTPAVPLSLNELTFGFGSRSQPRYLQYDCKQSWLFPSPTNGDGVYIIHGNQVQNTLLSKLHYVEPQVIDKFVSAQLRYTNISYQQRAFRDNPAFTIYRKSSFTHPTVPDSAVVWAASAEILPAVPMTSGAIQIPAAFDGPLALIGLQESRTKDNYELETWWEVLSTTPGANNISIMAHLLNLNGEIVGVADGLGITSDMWVIDDIIVQRHRFPIADAATASFFRTGLYRLDTGERYALQADPQADAVYYVLDENN
ncbi:MAG: hypothetical protein P1S60_17410, partial [Anaerolineae bacterium]|nr:hypothetical protein [Anaerolineae bacterium]